MDSGKIIKNRRKLFFDTERGSKTCPNPVLFMTSNECHKEDDKRVKHADDQLDSLMKHRVTWHDPIRIEILRH